MRALNTGFEMLYDIQGFFVLAVLGEPAGRLGQTSAYPPDEDRADYGDKQQKAPTVDSEHDSLGQEH